MNKKILSAITATALTLPSVVFAANAGAKLQGILDRFLNIVVLPVFSAIIVIMFLWAGYLFLTAQGDPTKITTAKKAVIWGVVGVAVAFLSYSVVGFVKTILG